MRSPDTSTGLTVGIAACASAGTGAAGTLYESFGASNKPLEEIARASAGPKWFARLVLAQDVDFIDVGHYSPATKEDRSGYSHEARV
jgi:hypothetical protein